MLAQKGFFKLNRRVWVHYLVDWGGVAWGSSPPEARHIVKSSVRCKWAGAWVDLKTERNDEYIDGLIWDRAEEVERLDYEIKDMGGYPL